MPDTYLDGSGWSRFQRAPPQTLLLFDIVLVLKRASSASTYNSGIYRVYLISEIIR